MGVSLGERRRALYVAVCGPDPAAPDVAAQAEEVGRLLAQGRRGRWCAAGWAG